MLGRNQIFEKTGAVMDINEYYPFGLVNQQTSSTQIGSKEQRYKFGSKELMKDFGLESEDYGARLYSPQIGRWQRVDPLADKMKSWSPYNYAFDNPVRFIDPDGKAPSDHYLNKAGKYIGSDNSGNNYRVTSISTSAGLKYALKNQGQDAVRSRSPVIKVNDAAVPATLAEQKQTSLTNQVEQKSYIILDTKNAEVSLQRQPQLNGVDMVDRSENRFNILNLPGTTTEFKIPDGGKASEVIVGQTHEHIGVALSMGNAIQGPSPSDASSAQNLGAPVYPVDGNTIHKVDQNGNKSTLQNQKDLLIDALKTYSGAP